MKAYKVLEVQNFERSSSPVRSMRIGVTEKINDFMNRLRKRFIYDAWNFKINEDLTIDIFWIPVFDISHPDFETLPEYIRFNRIGSHFACRFGSKESLKFFPKEIDGSCQVFYDKIEITPEDIRSVCNVKDSISFTSLSLHVR